MIAFFACIIFIYSIVNGLTHSVQAPIDLRSQVLACFFCQWNEPFPLPLRTKACTLDPRRLLFIDQRWISNCRTSTKDIGLSRTRELSDRLRWLHPLQPCSPRQATQQGTERMPRQRGVRLQKELAPLSLSTTRLAARVSPPHLQSVASTLRQMLLHTSRSLLTVALFGDQDVTLAVEATQNHVSPEFSRSTLARNTDLPLLLEETHLPLSRETVRSWFSVATERRYIPRASELARRHRPSYDASKHNARPS